MICSEARAAERLVPWQDGAELVVDDGARTVGAHHHDRTDVRN